MAIYDDTLFVVCLILIVGFYHIQISSGKPAPGRSPARIHISRIMGLLRFSLVVLSVEALWSRFTDGRVVVHKTRD